MIRVKQVKIDALLNNESTIKKSISKKLNIKENEILDYKIVKQSLDARNKNQIFYVYEFDVELINENKISFNNEITITPNENYNCIKEGSITLDKRPVIVGFGPSGIFASLLLAMNGYKPIIIERGSKVDKRIKDVEEFWKTGVLNTKSNVQFGEGGAGTFSDGKLNTGVKDKENRIKFIMETFVKFGAPEDILYSYKPHIGTNKLVNVVKSIREYIETLGGTFYFDTCVTNIISKNNKITGIEIDNKEIIETDVVILGIGHSARDTFKMLNDNNIKMENKPFAVGLRVQHSQDEINKSQYGEKYKDSFGAAPYKLTYQSSNGHGVYSFCMCPGGYVVNASSENNRLAINGMSNYERDSKNANSALIVTVNENIYGSNLFDGIRYQAELENKAYNLCNGKIPVQLLIDYKNNKESNSFKSILPEIKGEYAFANLNNIMPKELNDALIESFDYFENKIKGFNNDDAILAGIESRTSSPIRINRDDVFESNIKGLYPCGEGAGYAGGITSAAMDGLRVAEAIINKYTM